MQTTRSISALAAAALLFGTVPSVASAQTAPSAAPTIPATTSPMTTPTKAPNDVMTPAVAPTPGGAMNGGAMRHAAPATLAIDARSLRAYRTAAGYTLTGQALVKDACQSARFDRLLGNIFPPQFNLDQFRRPGTLGMLCIEHLTWVTAEQRTVTSAHPPRYVTVRTQKRATRVPIR
jgi:hypothetical protein